MTHPALIERITRSLAYMLRHQPEEFDLELDAQGYGDSERIVQALNERLGEPVSMADLEDAIHSGDRPRYEIVGNRIRALYGHSIDVEPGEPSRPPEVLHVGISARDADRAMRYGLRGGRRRFLHLALTTDDAREGGRRTGRDYVILTVYALDAWEEGINFFDRKALFLAEQIPIEFLEIGESFHDGIEPEARGPAGRREHGREHGNDRQRGGGSHRGGHRGDREPAPRREFEPAQGDEPEGFGEGSSEAIQADRERGPQPISTGSSGFSRGGEAPRSERDSRGGARHGGDRGGRGPRDESRPMRGPSTRPQPTEERSGSWGGEPPAEPRFEREQRSFAGDRSPDRSRAAGPDANERGQRGAPREFEAGRAQPSDERRNRQGDRPERPFEHAGGRENRPDRGEQRGFDRGERSERPPQDRPAPRAPTPPPPERVERAESRPAPCEPAPGFGLGLFEEPAVQ